MSHGNYTNKNNGATAKHTLAIVGVLVCGGLLVWIIQLARSGDSIGYIILTGLGVLLAMPVAGGVVAMLLHVAGKLLVNQQGSHVPRDDLKSIKEAHEVLRAQNRYLTHLFQQAQQNPALLSGNTPPADAQPPAPQLAPGQMQTASGHIIDGVAFDTLDDAYQADHEEEIR